jgi:putative hydrolase of the HAD superfamily
MAPSVGFIYFDLGKVLVHFDVARMCRQIAAVTEVEPEQIHRVLYEEGLQRDYELGLISSEEFYERFCGRVGRRPDRKKLLEAACDIFWLNVSVVPIVSRLAAIRFPIGVLSNTCEVHWEYIHRRYRGLMELFPVGCASFQVHAMKPDERIFRQAAQLAGFPPEKIFFVDDHPPNVAGAQRAGFQAVQFLGAESLLHELEIRGVPVCL